MGRLRHVRIEKCLECRYPTKERYKPIPNGMCDIPLCKKCQQLIPKPLNPFETIIEEEERLEARKAYRK